MVRFDSKEGRKETRKWEWSERGRKEERMDRWMNEQMNEPDTEFSHGREVMSTRSVQDFNRMKYSIWNRNRIRFNPHYNNNHNNNKNNDNMNCSKMNEYQFILSWNSSASRLESFLARNPRKAEHVLGSKCIRMQEGMYLGAQIAPTWMNLCQGSARMYHQRQEHAYYLVTGWCVDNNPQLLVCRLSWRLPAWTGWPGMSCPLHLLPSPLLGVFLELSSLYYSSSSCWQ